jgi:hypothetical protein
MNAISRHDFVSGRQFSPREPPSGTQFPKRPRVKRMARKTVSNFRRGFTTIRNPRHLAPMA